MTLIFLGTFAGSLVLSFILTKLVRDLAVGKKWVAAPAQARHLHNHALPRLGGVAIASAFLISIFVALAVCRFLNPAGENISLHPLVTILPPAILI
ncbi:MAG TPA: hypothetical protein VIL63_10980, partial [Terriglobales bacterium]